ncbi:MAG: hypothetical protein K5764_00810 [Prevotella sp.]|nr:hypothetical protein [Prevotella sp.]
MWRTLTYRHKALEQEWSTYNPKELSGRNRRLLFEWRTLDQRLSGRPDIAVSVVERNGQGLPVCYHVTYHVRSICGVTHVERLNEPGVQNEPCFADSFEMELRLPPAYPSVDGSPRLHFLTTDAAGNDLPHPWHPNIRYFGSFAGRVCLNQGDTYTDLAWAVERVALYLRYERYHAVQEPPYPEDLQVAAWVVAQGEPNGWLSF